MTCAPNSRSCTRPPRITDVGALRGTRSELARRKEWSALAGVLIDDVVSQLVPQGTYAKLPGVLASWYDSLCDGIALDTPPDPGNDDEFAAMIDRIKAIPAMVS
jgi:hypothetical protein